MYREPVALGFVALLTLCIPRSAQAEHIELTLAPHEPPRPVTLPIGTNARDVHVSVVDLEVDAGRRPSRRIYTMAGRAIPISPRVSNEPFRVHATRVRGREVLLLSATSFIDAGRVERVTVRLTVGASSGLFLAPVPTSWAEALPAPDPVLAIVTNRIVAARSRTLERYVRWRESQGLTVIVGTEEDWDVPSDDELDGRAERIRAWLRSVRDEVGLGYVLLVGDPSPGTEAGVPMKRTHPMTALVRTYPERLQEHIDPVPTDHYYADLDGDWDLDDDGRFAEYPEDSGGNGIEWEPDALVGRLPVYWNDTTRLDEILEAIIEFETDSDRSYRHRVLLPAAFLGYEGGPTPTGRTYSRTTDGADVAEVIARAALDLDPSAEVVRFYEEDGLVPSIHPHEFPLEATVLMDQWQEGAGLVVAIGHGSPEGIYRAIWSYDHDDDGIPDEEDMSSVPFISTWALDELLSTPAALAFLSTCDAGWPEFWDNLGASTLARGSIATVASSRIAVGAGGDFEPDPTMGDADTLAYAFAYLILEGMSAGEALAYLRYGLPSNGWGYSGGYPLGGYGWLGKLEFNLYGDPLLSLGRCEGDEACAAPSACWDAGSCDDGFCVPSDVHVDCSDLDEECVVGVCDPESGECLAEPVDDGTACDDGRLCTEEDSCQEGECVSGEPVVCAPRPGYTVECSEDGDGCVYEREPVTDDEELERSDSGCDCRAATARPMKVFSLFY